MAYYSLSMFRSMSNFLRKGSNISVISVPYDGGQPKKGTGQGPQRLLEQTLGVCSSLGYSSSHSAIKPLCTASTPSSLSIGIKNVEQTGKVCQDLAAECYSLAKRNSFVTVLGGDHSIATGSIAGVGQHYPDLGVVWVDAHADINSHMTSTTGNIHGMPVAFLMNLDNSASLQPYSWMKFKLRPEKIVYIGLRDLDEPEKDFLKSLKIKYYTMSEVDDFGIGKVMSETLRHLGNCPLHLSFDIDALDILAAPSTGTAVHGGLTLREGRFIAEKLADTGRLVSMDLIEVNPLLGNEADVKKTVDAAHHIISFALGTKFD